MVGLLDKSTKDDFAIFSRLSMLMQSSGSNSTHV